MYRCLRYWEEDAAEVVLQADYKTGRPKIIEYGGHDEEMGRRRGIEKGREWDVAQE